MMRRGLQPSDQQFEQEKRQRFLSGNNTHHARSSNASSQYSQVSSEQSPNPRGGTRRRLGSNQYNKSRMSRNDSENTQDFFENDHINFDTQGNQFDRDETLTSLY